MTARLSGQKGNSRSLYNEFVLVKGMGTYDESYLHIILRFQKFVIDESKFSKNKIVKKALSFSYERGRFS